MAKNKEVLARFEKYQALYDDLSVRLDKLLEFEKEFESFSKDLRVLDEYYNEQWLDDIEDESAKDIADDFEITSEDAVWNLLSDHYEYNKKLLKICADELNK